MHDFDSPNPPNPSSGDSVGELIRLVGELPPIPDDVVERARVAAREEWRASLALRRRRRWLAAGSLAASLLVAVGLHLGSRQATDLEARHVTLAATSGSSMTRNAQPAAIGDWLEIGDRLATRDGRAALSLPDGTSVRLDVDTSMRLVSLDREGAVALDLERGALYVDSPPSSDSTDPSVLVATPFGQLTDIGTQFEVRLEADRLRLRVREGRVDVVDPPGGGRTSVSATDEAAELTIDRVGDHRRRTLPTHGEAWRPYLDVAPPPELDGATVAEVLRWVGRETGWAIVWSDPAIERQRRETVLRGDFAGVPVDHIPAVVLPTCGLSARLADGILLIEASTAVHDDTTQEPNPQEANR